MSDNANTNYKTKRKKQFPLNLQFSDTNCSPKRIEPSYSSNQSNKRKYYKNHDSTVDNLNLFNNFRNRIQL